MAAAVAEVDAYRERDFSVSLRVARRRRRDPTDRRTDRSKKLIRERIYLPDTTIFCRSTYLQTERSPRIRCASRDLLCCYIQRRRLRCPVIVIHRPSRLVQRPRLYIYRLMCCVWACSAYSRTIYCAWLFLKPVALYRHHKRD